MALNDVYMLITPKCLPLAKIACQGSSVYPGTAARVTLLHHVRLHCFSTQDLPVASHLTQDKNQNS